MNLLVTALSQLSYLNLSSSSHEHNMEVWGGKVAVVTGASAGIGAAIVLDLARNGVQVVGLARRKALVEELAVQVPTGPGKIHALECDVSNTESIVEAFKWIQEKFGKVHIMINNAGRTKHGSTLDPELSHKEYLTTINLNISGLVVCTREAYKLMEIHDELGYIININSVLGHVSAQPILIMTNVYPATKHAVTNHTEMLRLELAVAGHKRIRVSSLSPGVVRTEFGATGGFDMSHQECQLDAQSVADAVKYLLSLPPHVNVSELTIKSTGQSL